MKCQSLIRSRWVPETKNEKGDIIRGFYRRLAEPEPCGENGSEYDVRKKAQIAKRPKRDIRNSMFVGNFQLPAGTMWVRQVFCDKHKRKAMRENNEVLPVDKAVDSVNIA